jgi:hypothetical protein
MSRTYAHVPYTVEVARANPAVVGTLIQQWVPGVGRVPITDPRAIVKPFLPGWACRQSWARHGRAVAERRAAVRDTLRAAAGQYRATGVVDVDLMPDPVRTCLCQCCGY